MDIVDLLVADNESTSTREIAWLEYGAPTGFLEVLDSLVPASLKPVTVTDAEPGAAVAGQCPYCGETWTFHARARGKGNEALEFTKNSEGWRRLTMHMSTRTEARATLDDMPCSGFWLGEQLRGRPAGDSQAG